MFRNLFSFVVLSVFSLALALPALATVQDDLADRIAVKEQRIQKKIQKIQAQKSALTELNDSIESAKREKIYARVAGAAMIGLGVFISVKSYKMLKSLDGTNRTGTAFGDLFMTFFQLPFVAAAGGGTIGGGALAVGGAVMVIFPPNKIKQIQDEIAIAQELLDELESELIFDQRELDELKAKL